MTEPGVTLTWPATRTLTVRALGTPAKKGSKSPKGHVRGRCILVESDKKLPDWTKAVQAAARNAVLAADWVPLGEACEVWLEFYLPKPKTVTREYPTGRGDGDGDKMVRAALDALTDIVYVDDQLVVDHHCSQRYAVAGQPTGARIRVAALSRQEALI